MPDYQKGKIYKLWSPQGNEIYIGSTINPLAKRLNQHKNDRDCRSKYLFENYDVVKIELIEEYPCNSKIELNRCEGNHIRKHLCLNKVIPGRTAKEWSKEYYENNKEHIKEYQKEWRENNKEKIKEYQEDNKEHAKEYYKNNKEQRREKFNCECGGRYSNDHKSTHYKTKKHLAFTKMHQ